MTKIEIEISRGNTTPAQFLCQVRYQIRKKGLECYASDLNLNYFAAGNDLNFEYHNNPEKPCKAEKSVSKPYQMQTYIRNWDGTLYNEIVEFDFWDENTGTGYYYLCDIH